MWHEGCIVETWKLAIVTPIPKPDKDKSQVENYRPISLTSCLMKVMEKMVSSRIQWYLEEHSLYNTTQSAYRKAHSTYDSLVRMHDSIHKGLAYSEHTLAVFLDISKAFDAVWHASLLHKLWKLGIRGRILTFIKSFLSNRYIRVKINNSLSDKTLLETDVPQGSVLSTLLFNVYINDIPNHTVINSGILADDEIYCPPLGSSIQFSAS